MLGGAREWNLVSEVGVRGILSLCAMRRSSMLAGFTVSMLMGGEGGGSSQIKVIKSSTWHSSNRLGTSLTPSGHSTVGTIVGPVTLRTTTGGTTCAVAPSTPERLSSVFGSTRLEVTGCGGANAVVGRIVGTGAR